MPYMLGDLIWSYIHGLLFAVFFDGPLPYSVGHNYKSLYRIVVAGNGAHNCIKAGIHVTLGSQTKLQMFVNHYPHCTSQRIRV